MSSNRACYLGGFGLLAVSMPFVAGGQCSVLVPHGSALLPGEGVPCEQGHACEVSPCTGWLVIQQGTVQVVFRNTSNRSDVIEVDGRFDLDTLQTGGALTAAIRNLVSALFGRSDPNLRPLAGRAALTPAAGGDALPSGPIAVLPNAGVSFSIPSAAPGAAYAFRPQDNSAAVTRVVAGDDGRFHIAAQALPPGTRFVGGLEGEATVPFQVATADRLDRVAAELESQASLTPAAAASRRALIYFDNGFAWNAERELAELAPQGEGTP